jgi:hypothetical protein
MRTKAARLLGLACLILALKGDSCILEERDHEYVVRADVPATWLTQGSNSAGSDTEVVAAAEEVENALSDLSEDAVVESIHISGVCYEVLENRGFVGMHSGTVTVDGPGGTPLALLSFSAPSNATGVTGGTEGAEVSLMAPGVNFINGRLASYLASSDPLLLNFTFRASWTSTDPGSAEYDFDWKTCLILQVTGTLNLEVFNP